MAGDGGVLVTAGHWCVLPLTTFPGGHVRFSFLAPTLRSPSQSCKWLTRNCLPVASRGCILITENHLLLQSQILQTFLDLAVLKSKVNISHVASFPLPIIMRVCYSIRVHVVHCKNSSWSIICHGSSCHKLKTFSSYFVAQTKSILDVVCTQSISSQKKRFKYMERQRKGGSYYHC